MTTLPLNNPAVIAIAVAGVLIAFTVFRSSKKRTAQERTARDMRSDLRMEFESLRAALEALPTQIDFAMRSRAAAARAARNLEPEGPQLGQSQMDLDVSEVELLRSQLSAVDADDYKSLSDMEVDIKLVEVLALSLRASTLADRYRGSGSAQETHRGIRNEDGEALLLDATAQYALNNSGPQIGESVR